MANTSNVGATATILASLGTIFLMIISFSMITKQSDFFSGPSYVGYSVVIWMSIVVLAFGCTGAVYSIKKRHFWLALTGAVVVLALSMIENYFLLSAPIYGNPVESSKIFSFFISIFQMFSGLAGIVFTALAKRQFT
jgi:hypothetical protein